MFEEGSLRRILSSYFNDYHRQKTLLYLEKDSPEPLPIQLPEIGPVVALPRSVDGITASFCVILPDYFGPCAWELSFRCRPYDLLRPPTLISTNENPYVLLTFCKLSFILLKILFQNRSVAASGTAL